VTVEYLELADFLLIAEAVLQKPAREIAAESELSLADSALHAPRGRFAGQDFYPDFPTKAAVLCTHLIKNHALRDGNTPVALIATIEFCRRNGFAWTPPPGDEDGEATAAVFLSVAATTMNAEQISEVAQWIGVGTVTTT
jgi:death-on-curing protein